MKKGEKAGEQRKIGTEKRRERRGIRKGEKAGRNEEWINEEKAEGKEDEGEKERKGQREEEDVAIQERLRQVTDQETLID